MHGPGDITGIDPALIGPMQPVRDAEGFEPNYFPAVEFRSPEFPWMFTPASANTGGQLRPWLCLVAIERPDEVPPGDAPLWPLNPDPTLPLPQVHIDDADKELPDPADTFAWAHVQVAGTIPAGGSVAELIAQSPGAVTSRLLCARRLREDTSYVACVVPVFLAGRQAGLGEEVTADDLTYAWQAGKTDFWLPVYHHWEFSTGAAGDFESLVRALEARPLPPEVAPGHSTRASRGAACRRRRRRIRGWNSAWRAPSGSRAPRRRPGRRAPPHRRPSSERSGPCSTPPPSARPPTRPCRWPLRSTVAGTRAARPCRVTVAGSRCRTGSAS